MNRFERYLFPQGPLVNFLTIVVLSGTFSALLIGRQIFYANWGILDDHEVFHYLGPTLHLPFSDIWSTLLERTEVGTLEGRFRPSYYLIKVVESSFFGSDVHLWYLGNTIAFTMFLSSIWWVLRRFVGGWLSGALTIWISILPLWADVWSRLGPSEIGGAACVGAMIFATDFVLFSDSRRVGSASAIALALATIALMGMKETFLPLAAGTAVVFILAWMRRKLSALLIVSLSLLILVSLASEVLVVMRQTLGAGKDFYGNSTGLWPTIKFGIIGVLDGLLRTWWLYTLPIIFLQLFNLLPRKSLGDWISNSNEAVWAYCFLITMYAAQCALYRSSFPHNSRYDFPAMLLVPLTCCILVSEIASKARKHFPARTMEYAQLIAATFLFFALLVANLGPPLALSTAVKTNIKVTNLFYNELQRLTHAAKASPAFPIIIDAHGPFAYEPVLSLSFYLSSLGASNPISVRYHPDDSYKGAFFDGAQRSLLALQEADSGAFTPLQKTLASHAPGCLSVGIDGQPDASCSGFEVISRSTN